MTINSVEELRDALRDYYGSAYFTLGHPVILNDLTRVETADLEELIEMAREANLLEE